MFVRARAIWPSVPWNCRQCSTLGDDLECGHLARLIWRNGHHSLRTDRGTVNRPVDREWSRHLSLDWCVKSLCFALAKWRRLAWSPPPETAGASSRCFVFVTVFHSDTLILLQCQTFMICLWSKNGRDDAASIRYLRRCRLLRLLEIVFFRHCWYCSNSPRQAEESYCYLIYCALRYPLPDFWCQAMNFLLRHHKSQFLHLDYRSWHLRCACRSGLTYCIASSFLN